MKTIQTLALAVSALLLTGAAQASNFNNTDGLTGMMSFTTQTFNGTGAANNTLAGNLFAGLSFGANMYTSEQYSGAFAHFDGTSITNFQPCCTAVTEFSFTAPVQAAAFAFVTNPGNSTFIAKYNGVAVESFTAATSTSGAMNYYGFKDITFNSIEIRSGGVNNAYAMDNLQVAAVPEPETYGMMLAGLGCWA